MSNDQLSAAVRELQASAAAFQDGIRKANRLPDGYPKAEMEAISEQVRALAGADDEDLRVIVHLRDKLLQSIDAYPSTYEGPATDHLRRLHADVFIAAARFVTNVEPQRAQAALPGVQSGKLTAEPSDYRLATQELLSNVRSVLETTASSNVVVQQYITNNSFSLIDLRHLQFALGGIRKACLGISIELSAKVLDLSWLAEFMKWVSSASSAVAVTCSKLGDQFASSALGRMLSEAVSFCSTVVKQVGSLIETIVRAKKYERHHGIEDKPIDDRYSRQSRKELEAANRAKTVFLASLSHELRQSLNSVLGFTDILRGELYGPIGEERYKNYIEDVAASARSLLERSNDILDVNKIEMGRFSLYEEIFPIGDVVGEAVKMVRPQIESEGLQLKLSGDVEGIRIYGDRRQLLRALLNVLSNSVKFTRRGGTVSVASRLESGALSIVVTDTGIGMSEEVLAHATHVGSPASFEKGSGLGLGLPIAHAMIEQHGGTLEIQSQRGQGTTVAIRLPESRVHR